MTDEQLALLACIRANPDDDLSRLVYADWVEERGDQAMAELIRCHIERERAEPGTQRYYDLITHTGMLLAMNRDRWTAELQEQFGVTAVEFARGILDEVELSARQFGRTADQLLAAFPIRHVKFSATADVDTAYRVALPANVRRSIAVQIPFDLEHHFQWEGQGPVPFGQYSLELLPQAPSTMELPLRVGRWRILCPAVWSNPDLETESAFLRAFRSDPQTTTEFRELQLAVRRFDEPREFEAWCPVPNPQAGPHWIELENGRLINHRRGLDLPNWYPDDWYQEEE